MGRQILRRTFLKESAIALSGVALCDLSGIANAATTAGKSQVFFTTDISVNGLLKLYAKINEGNDGQGCHQAA